MSNEKWLKKLMEWKPKEQLKETPRLKTYCKGFDKGDNGFCKHYMGCKKVIVSCASECAYEGVKY